MTNKDKPTELSSELDIANWTAERMRKMHYPITEGKFMAGGKTPHQYMTAEIEGLLHQHQEDLKRRLLERVPPEQDYRGNGSEFNEARTQFISAIDEVFKGGE